MLFRWISGGESGLPILFLCHCWSCYFFINQFKCCLLTALENGDWPLQISLHWPFPHPSLYFYHNFWFNCSSSLVVQLVKCLPAVQETQDLIPGSGRSPRGGWQPTLVFLPGGFHGQRSLAGCCPRSQRVRHDWTEQLTLSLWLNWWSVFMLLWK